MNVLVVAADLLDHLLDVEVATKGARCSTIAAAPPTAAADPLALAYTQSFAAGGTACRFRLTFANGDRRRLVVLAQANDATALQRWTQGLQAVRLCRPQPGGPQLAARRRTTHTLLRAARRRT